MDDTQIQLQSPEGEAAKPHASGQRDATVCPLCAQHFSPDGRFCPFDGEALLKAPGWNPNIDPLLGTVVDNRYEIRSVLGEGGMGVVYEVRHRALGKGFALKALRKDLATDGEIAARFMQEARTAASVSHPGLVEITDFGRLATGQPFFVMELLQGQSLAALIRRGGPIPAARGVDIARQIAEALGAAHERSIVHRDLKPDNIHISPAPLGSDRVTIVDFGLAKVIGTSRMTRAGMVFGTPHYMSPEQAQGEVTDHRADIYALGVVMYEMFTGRVPFEADSYMGVLTKHMYMMPTPPSHLVGTEKLGALEDIILRCLEKKSENRYRTLHEFRQALDLALNAIGLQAASASGARRAAPRSLLADELELPSREELALGQQPLPAPKSFLGWPVVAAGAIFLVGLVGVLSLRRQAAPAIVVEEPVGAAGALPHQTRLDVSAVAPQPTVQVASAHPASEPPIRPSTGHEAQQAPLAADNAQALRKPPSQPGAGARATVSHPLPAPKKLVGLGSSEIVDPWAK